MQVTSALPAYYCVQGLLVQNALQPQQQEQCARLPVTITSTISSPCPALNLHLMSDQ